LSGVYEGETLLGSIETQVWRLRAGICDVDEGETVVGQAFAALPPDVRKVYDLPIAPL